MNLAIALAILAGVFGVLQAGMNKEIADSLGFTASLLFNGFFFLAFNSLFFLFVWWKPQSLGADFAIQWAFSDFRWWWVVPGFLGFALVMGLAVGVARIGATQTFVISVAAQVIASVLWDIYSGSGQPVTTLRVAGATVAFVGALLSTLG